MENVIYDLCRELPKRNWEAVLALAKGNRFNDPDKYRQIYPDLKTVEIDGTKGTRQARLEELIKTIESSQPDIVLNARIFDVYEAVGSIKRRKRGNIRLATSIQNYEAPYFFDAKLYKNVIDLCITSGNMIREATLHFCGIAPERIISIPGGVRPPLIDVKPRRISKKIRLGYVGRIEQQQKRILDLVPFLEMLDAKKIPYSFDIIGTGKAESTLLAQLVPWIEGGQVHFHGWQENERLYSHFFPNMDCFVHFAETEGVSIAPREAMANGVVPVISEFTGLKTEKHFCHEVNCLTFPIGDIAQAVEHVVRLFLHPEILMQLSSNAMQSQLGEYTYQGAIDTWAEALDRCMEMPLATGDFPCVEKPDGRLAKWGLSPWWAQRIRDLLGKNFIHREAGSEWPNKSGFASAEFISRVMKFAQEHEMFL